MTPEEREAWAKRLMDDPKVNGDAADASDPTSPAGMDAFAQAMLRRARERNDDG